MRTDELLGLIRLNRYNAEILNALPELGLPEGMLVGGCLFQTVWNIKSGRPPEEGIKDYDIFYFDPADLSAETENKISSRLASVFENLKIVVDVANQARVHLWYESHFGIPRAALSSAKEGVDNFLMPCTCLGISVSCDGGTKIYAPHGLKDLSDGIVRPNPWINQSDLFQKKAASYRSRWPWLSIQTEA